MISDVMYDAIGDIEYYQRELPDIYDAVEDHIGIVKKVMRSLAVILGEPDPPSIPESLLEDEKDWYRVICEAQIARWAERLRALVPITAEELATKLNDAIQRQEALLAKRRGSKNFYEQQEGERETYLYQPILQIRPVRSTCCGERQHTRYGKQSLAVRKSRR